MSRRLKIRTPVGVRMAFRTPARSKLRTVSEDRLRIRATSDVRTGMWSSPGFPDGLVRLGKGGFMLGRTSLAESGVPPLPIVEDLDVLKEIRPRRGP